MILLMAIQIFTSLPPHMNRFDEAGNNIGSRHFRRCLQSWIDNGFEIVTINSAQEKQGEIAAEFPIKRIIVDRDANEICGKPLVHFSDFMKTIYDHATGPFIITNADIELDICETDLEKIRYLKPGSFICERRTDYEPNAKAGGKPYQGGFDFFVLHPTDLERHFECNLVFGMPWWDHYIPVNCIRENFDQVQLNASSYAYHLVHDERWDMANFRKFGNLYRLELDRIRHTGDSRVGFETMMQRIAETEKKNIYFPYARRENFLPNLFRFKPKDRELNILYWIAFYNFRLMKFPDERPMPNLSLSRFIQRLPF